MGDYPTCADMEAIQDILLSKEMHGTEQKAIFGHVFLSVYKYYKRTKIPHIKMLIGDYIRRMLLRLIRQLSVFTLCTFK